MSKYLPSLWGEREVEFSQKLQNLQAMKTFNHTEFERTVDEFQSCVTEVIVFCLVYIAKAPSNDIYFSVIIVHIILIW
jgi:hypothetical protein